MVFISNVPVSDPVVVIAYVEKINLVLNYEIIIRIKNYTDQQLLFLWTHLLLENVQEKSLGNYFDIFYVPKLTFNSESLFHSNHEKLFIK